MVDHTVACQACATRDMVQRQLMEQHEKDPDIPGVPRWQDGRMITVRPATPADLRAAAKGQAKTLTRHG